MESGDCVRSNRVKVLSGTAFAKFELLVMFEEVVSFAPTPVLIALLGGVRTPDEGVYFTGVVSAFEPAAEPSDLWALMIASWTSSSNE